MRTEVVQGYKEEKKLKDIFNNKGRNLDIVKKGSKCYKWHKSVKNHLNLNKRDPGNERRQKI